MKTTPHIFIADGLAGDVSFEQARLGELGWEWSLPEHTGPLGKAEQEAELLRRIARCPNITGVLFSLAPLTTKVINALPPSCIHLQRVGIGLDNVDQEAVRARGFTLGNTPDYATEEVAVQAMAMILALHRQLGPTQKALAAGIWRSQPPAPIERLSTLTLGLVGLGRIGRKVGEYMQRMVREVRFHDPMVKEAPPGMRAVSLEQLLRQSDIVSLHCPLLPGTRHLINRTTLGQMKAQALLINVSRGALIDVTALHEAMTQGKLAGAALDVYDPEVLPKESPLHSLNNIILTSHTAWYSRQSVMDCHTQAMDKLVAAIQARLGARQ